MGREGVAFDNLAFFRGGRDEDVPEGRGGRLLRRKTLREGRGAGVHSAVGGGGRAVGCCQVRGLGASLYATGPRAIRLVLRVYAALFRSKGGFGGYQDRVVHIRGRFSQRRVV